MGFDKENVSKLKDTCVRIVAILDQSPEGDISHMALLSLAENIRDFLDNRIVSNSGVHPKKGTERNLTVNQIMVLMDVCRGSNTQQKWGTYSNDLSVLRRAELIRYVEGKLPSWELTEAGARLVRFMKTYEEPLPETATN
jgi:hypothetical protein